MGEHTSIEWADHTFNPWIGCTKVSPACAHCYAESFAKRTNKAKWGDHGSRVVTSDANWRKPLKWNLEAGYEGVRKRVFCASLADLFEDWQGPMMGSGRDDGELAINDERSRLLTMADVRGRLFKLIDATPWLDWLLLTKRPENILRVWPMEPAGSEPIFPGAPGRLGDPQPCYRRFRRENVWLGTTVENQEFADQRIPELLKCRELAPVLFLSMEPLLGAVDLSRYWVEPECSCYEVIGGGHQMGCMFYGMSSEEIRAINHAPPNGPDWVITGGESGGGARPSHPDWFRTIRDQCATADVPHLFKQWGDWAPRDVVPGGDLGGDFRRGNADIVKPFGEPDGHFRRGDALMGRVGKKAAGRLLDGIEHNGFPVAEAHA